MACAISSASLATIRAVDRRRSRSRLEKCALVFACARRRCAAVEVVLAISDGTQLAALGALGDELLDAALNQ